LNISLDAIYTEGYTYLIPVPRWHGKESKMVNDYWAVPHILKAGRWVPATPGCQRTLEAWPRYNWQIADHIRNGKAVME